MRAVRWARPLTDLPGVGAATAERAEAMGLATIGDLVEHLPARYLSYDDARPVAEARPGDEVTVRVRLQSIEVRPTRRRRLRLVRARVSDATGSLVAVWFNQDYLARLLTPGDELLLRGRVDPGLPRQLSVRAHEVLGGVGSEGLHTTGLVPVYPASEALPARRIRELVDAARPDVGGAPERLPAWMRLRLGLPTAADALGALHRPRSAAEPRLGRRRLAFEELLVLQLGLLAIQRGSAEHAMAPELRPTGELAGPLLAGFGFELTAEQQRVTGEIARDLSSERPMRRLLQGEVGAGKTVVAALAMCQVVEADHQAALLVPTEVLAEQHLATLDRLFAPTGIVPVLLTGRVARAERERRLELIATGTAPIVVGTQALLSEGVRFARLGLAVVDEQHRFGVAQRQHLAERARAEQNRAAHVLYMTATPIPRTLALTAFGDLRVSTIHGRPPGRQPVETSWVREGDRELAYERVRAELRAGRQAYVICPLVEEGEAIEARAATEEAERLASGPFRDFSIGLAHGALATDEKRRVMDAFARGDLDILVATTVVEVGVDVPNATAMVIEGADRFGLAQLHQLRGRIGRGGHAGLCLLFGEPTTEEGTRRLEAIVQETDGFRLSELDLEIRGEGAMLGLRQSGASDLRFARLSRDRGDLARARHVARATLRRDPRLLEPEHVLLRRAVLDRFDDLPRLLDG